MGAVPRLIDHAARRTELAEAVWRVVGTRGVGAVSVRNVAAEAGVSAGSLRHVLPTREAMLAAATDLVVERARVRFLARAGRGVSTRADVVALLGELLPLDQERRLELRAHLALVLGSAGDPGLDEARSTLDAGVREACRAALDRCHDLGLLRPGLDLDAETVRLHVVVDGLALHLLGPALRMRGSEATALLDAHLAAIWST
jgi:AcrR family transcriptional regulator